jgi:hypothetical protein
MPTSGASTRSVSGPSAARRKPLIHWVNRPTYQQANEIAKRVGR